MLFRYLSALRHPESDVGIQGTSVRSNIVVACLVSTLVQSHAAMHLLSLRIGLPQYDNHAAQQFEGISLHADVARVNTNLWITPEDANLDHDGGGLVH